MCSSCPPTVGGECERAGRERKEVKTQCTGSFSGNTCQHFRTLVGAAIETLLDRRAGPTSQCCSTVGSVTFPKRAWARAPFPASTPESGCTAWHQRAHTHRLSPAGLHSSACLRAPPGSQENRPFHGASHRRGSWKPHAGPGSASAFRPSSRGASCHRALQAFRPGPWERRFQSVCPKHCSQGPSTSRLPAPVTLAPSLNPDLPPGF